MQKQYRFLLFTVTIFSFLILSGCKKTDSTPTAASTTTIPKDLTKEEIIAEAQKGANGDPRGTYYMNTPIITFFTNEPSINLQYKSETKNEASGSTTIEGSATEGTWKSTNVSENVDVVLTIEQNGQSTDVPVAFTESGSKTGTWKIVPGQKVILQENGSSTPADTVDFGITAKGMFLGKKLPNHDNVLVITAWKK